jgi:hypothetical protein
VIPVTPATNLIGLVLRVDPSPYHFDTSVTP